MRALQKLKHYGSVTCVTMPRVMLRHLAWFAGDSVMEQLTNDQTLLVRRPTEDDVQKIQKPDGYVLDHYAVLRLSQQGNTVNLTIKRDFLIRLGWITGNHVIVEVLEQGVVRIRAGETRDIQILLGNARISEPPGAVRS